MGLPSFPITAQLKFWKPSNWPYLITAVIMTRLGVAAIRIFENRPSQQKGEGVTPNQKRQAMWERFYVEVPGTLASIIPIHFVSDLASKVFEQSNALQIPQIPDTHIALTAAERQKINTSLLEVFGKHAKDGPAKLTQDGLVFRRLFGEYSPALKKNVKAQLSTLHEELGSALFNKAREAIPSLEKWAVAVNRRSSICTFLGIGAGALASGFGTQWSCDRLWAPFVEKRLSGLYPEGDVAAPPSFSVTSISPSMPVAAPQWGVQPPMQNGLVGSSGPVNFMGYRRQESVCRAPVVGVMR